VVSAVNEIRRLSAETLPFQCTNEPPNPCPGRKLSHRRIGSAVWSEVFRKVNCDLHVILHHRLANWKTAGSSWIEAIEIRHGVARRTALQSNDVSLCAGELKTCMDSG